MQYSHMLLSSVRVNGNPTLFQSVSLRFAIPDGVMEDNSHTKQVRHLSPGPGLGVDFYAAN